MSDHDKACRLVYDLDGEIEPFPTDGMVRSGSHLDEVQLEVQVDANEQQREYIISSFVLQICTFFFLVSSRKTLEIASDKNRRDGPTRLVTVSLGAVCRRSRM